MIKTAVRQPLAFRDKSVWQLQGAVLHSETLILQIMVATSSCLTSCCCLTLSLNLIAWMHSELVACDWLLSFLYLKAIGHSARRGRMVCNNFRCFIAKMRKRPFFFPKRWLEFYDQVTEITAPPSKICERLLSRLEGQPTQVCQPLWKAAVSPPCATPLHVNYPSASSSYPFQHLR